MKKRYLLPMLATGAYTASPIDVVPDFIPLAGQADDMALIILACLMMLVFYMLDKDKAV